MSTKRNKKKKSQPEWLKRGYMYQKPAQSTQIEEWSRLWSSYIYDEFSDVKDASLFVTEIHKKEYISRLSRSDLIDILNYATLNGSGKWVDTEKTNFFILSSPLEKWAERVHEKYRAHSRPLGVYQLEVDIAFSFLPRTLLTEVLVTLVNKKMARWWPGKMGVYVELIGVGQSKPRGGSRGFKFWKKDPSETIGDLQSQIDQMESTKNSYFQELISTEGEIQRLLSLGEERAQETALDLVNKVEGFEKSIGELNQRVASLDGLVLTLLTTEQDALIETNLRSAQTLLDEAKTTNVKLQERIEDVVESKMEIDASNEMFNILSTPVTPPKISAEDRLQKYRAKIQEKDEQVEPEKVDKLAKYKEKIKKEKDKDKERLVV